jgi:hypothetical protein
MQSNAALSPNDALWEIKSFENLFACASIRLLVNGVV